jgi:hypothetical protein
MMALAAFYLVTQLIFVLFPGLVLHRALARRILKWDGSTAMDEVDLLGFGLLPGLVLAGTVGTILAIFQAFYLWSYLAVMILIVVVFRRDAIATLAAIKSMVERSLKSLMQGNLMIVVAVAIFVQTAAGMLAESLVPSAGIDIWHHNFPLAKSIVDHHGFRMPQIDSMFYGSYPLFHHMFFAQALLLADTIVAAKVANAMIYLGFLLSLVMFARHLRSVIILLMSYLIIETPFFSFGTADLMTDTTRICFSTLAFVFAYQYLRRGQVYFLFASGLLAGGAVAGKYTELLTPLLIGLSLLPALIGRKPDAWRAVLVFTTATLAIGLYPYVRNLILLHNPIYPFLFGHPGISDEYMAALKTEFSNPLDPVFLTYSQNLLTPAGWRDFAIAAWQVFLSAWKLKASVLVVIAAGLIFLRSRALAWFAVWTLVMWVYWYIIGNMTYRWGLPAMLLLLTMTLLVFMELLDRAADKSAAAGNSWSWPFQHVAAGRLTPLAVARGAGAALALYIAAVAIHRVSIVGMHAAFPKWLPEYLAVATLQPGGLDAQLPKNIEGYQVYRYIGEHDLKMVLQPFDVGATYYPSAYNGGRQGEWILPWSELPKDPSEYDQFLQARNVRYFIYSPSITPLLAHRLNVGGNNPRHVETAYQFMHYLLPKSRPILTDSFGWELRQIKN